MHLVTVAVALTLAAAMPAAPDNPCTNGSFEELSPNGFPVDWGPVGVTVEVSSDAHSGQRSLRLLRTAESKTPETGINRGWRPGTGRQGAMIEQLKGGIDFYYKAISAEGAQLNVYAIPMTDEPIERTGSPRATFTVPEAHVGDGQWHHARLKYDFTDNPKARWVHFAARIVGTAGELLLDDFSYVERVGTILRFGRIRLEEDPERPGQRCTVRVDVENAGDTVAQDIQAAMTAPNGLAATPAAIQLGSLAPDEKRRAEWVLEGPRTAPLVLGFTAASGTAEALASLEIAPGLQVESFGPKTSVALVGEPVTLECVLKNTGSAILLNPRAEFEFPTGAVTRSVDRLAPGRTAVLRAEFRFSSETSESGVFANACADNVEGEQRVFTSLVVGGAGKLPEPSGRLSATATADYAVLENEHLRLGFRRNEFGFGVGELSARTPSGWQTVAWIPYLSLLWPSGDDAAGEDSVELDEEQVKLPDLDEPDGLSEGRQRALYCDAPPEAETGARATLRFVWAARDKRGAAWRLRAVFGLAEHEKSISVRYELTCNQRRTVVVFCGPMLHALDRDEAVFPGLEWLIDDEISSSTLDIAEGHPHQDRRMVHPNMVTIPAVGIHSRHGTVGLIWDVHQKWDGRRDRPAVYFDSPARQWVMNRSHVVGLLLPGLTQPDFPGRAWRQPCPIEPGTPLSLQCHIFADGLASDALAAIDEWARLYGWPEPAPLPHGSYDREIEFSMQAYLKSLWEPETKDWWTTKSGGMMSNQGRPRTFVADLLLGEILSPDERVRRACRDRGEEVLSLIGGEPRVDAQRFPGRADLAMAHPARAAGLLAGRRDDGSWRFDADQRHTSGPFVGKDYYELGPDEALEVGTCARRAFEVLRYARIAGDREAYDQMRKTLELMESFRVPRAAQVWEVPVHTPDVLAAADAVDAYLEAYRFAGDERWLRDAVTWARRGLPFIYLWDDPERPFLVGGSIPVFGATWYQGSWFGRPVQWNGLRYANALLKLSEYDDSRPWRRIAETIIRSAIHQQDQEGENVALWPDNISAIDSEKCPWVFAPRQIIRNVLKLTGRDEDPATVIIGQGERRLHVTATARVSDAVWDGAKLGFQVEYPRGEQGVVLVSNVTRPKAVLLDGKKVTERDEVEKGSQSGWRYDAANAYLSIRATGDGARQVRVDGAEFRPVQRLPWLAGRIAFEFDRSLEGWMAAHDVAQMVVEEGTLAGKISGDDPYLVRTLLRVSGDASPVIRLRMRVTAGQGGQLFWTTESSPAFAEDKTVRFGIAADGQFHEYRLEPGTDPLWSGQTITAVRIDPGNGAASGEFAIDYVRGGKE